MSPSQRGNPWAGLELRHADGPPGWHLVTLHGGPLNGLRRHVMRGESWARFRHPTGDALYRYERQADGSWRFTAKCHLCEGSGRVIWPEYVGEDARDVPPCPECGGAGYELDDGRGPA